MKVITYDFVVIGGGVSAVTCAETLESLAKKRIALISATPLIKKVCNYFKLSKYIETFDVVELDYNLYNQAHSLIDIYIGKVTKINSLSKEIQTAKHAIKYKYALCICTGSSPKKIPCNISTDSIYGNILVLRDNTTVENLINKTKCAKSICIAGNGGIATELVYKIKNCQIIWIIKDETISRRFLTDGSANFFRLRNGIQPYNTIPQDSIKISESQTNELKVSTTYGSALGPNWHMNLNIRGNLADNENSSVQLITNAEIINIVPGMKDNLLVSLSNGQSLTCGFLINATGVLPNSKDIEFSPESPKLCPFDGYGIQVDESFKTSLTNIYAAGDVCTYYPSYVINNHAENYVNANNTMSPNWFQMRLWDQAYHMGYTAAQSMIKNSCDPTLVIDNFYFQLFTHTTQFFGEKVILLGIYNPLLFTSNEKNDKNFNNTSTQTNESNTSLISEVNTIHQYISQNIPKWELMVQIERDHYIELVLSPYTGFETELEDIDLRTKDALYVRGATLIGDTGMEETIENLILNQINVKPFGEDLLNPNIDIEDFFD